MNKNDSFNGLDSFRIVAALMVVAIHTSPFTSLDTTADFIFTYVISRIAVPFFLMITGYFSLNKCLQDRETLLKFLIKNSKIYLMAIILYIPLNIYAKHFVQGNLPVDIIKAIIFDGTFYHLWYFPAVITGVLIVYFFRKKFNLKTTFTITLLLYLIGLFGDSYYGLISNNPYIAKFYDGIFSVSSYTRNGIFYAPIFLVMGEIIALRDSKISKPKYLTCFFTSLLLMVLEGLILYKFQIQRHNSMYLLLLPCMFFLFQLLVKYKGNTSKSIRSITLWIYLIHPIMIVVVRGIAEATNTRNILINNSFLHYLAVSSLSICFSSFIYYTMNHREKNTFHKGRAWTEIDLNALRVNVDTIKELLPPSCEFMAAVKANAYGHGAIRVSKELNKLGIKAFCVASILEGISLRKSGVSGEILILGYTHPKQFYLLKRYHLTQTVIDYNYANQLNDYGKSLPVHIKIDTGMHRLGENCEHIPKILGIFHMKNLEVKGIYTHLCVSDSHQSDDEAFTKLQIEKFYSVVQAIEEQGIVCPKVHIQSSYGAINYPFLQCDYARIGIALYGVFSEKDDSEKYSIPLKPALSVKARIQMTRQLSCGESMGYGLQFTAKRNTKVAVVSIGYADGIPRCLSNGMGHVLIRNKRANIIGRVCMDQMLVDITDIPDVQPNDIATIIGESGDERITAMDMAEQANTITNEILSRLGSRLEQIYLYK
ncbi:serine-type alanine/serine racemase [Gottschalkia acidurici 9a]|uniref:Alanine racemase n=1 Tax=Gottschalkia acidurici (strain ATCC 7906 / DSM 604 / BCRC 14475 / CIP 104303 / KCTC 5404 / NCIMB 10678 / 9a) TaxID=1128398 RepID=K0AUM4_GOTA9|nr:serine racemase VanT catalytic subunit [Gottschalkia acidurici]AFS77583.1 serine-type alanine/serine racemase [Gottschalkia acidurici 9a]